MVKLLINGLSDSFFSQPGMEHLFTPDGSMFIRKNARNKLAIWTKFKNFANPF